MDVVETAWPELMPRVRVQSGNQTWVPQINRTYRLGRKSEWQLSSNFTDGQHARVKFDTEGAWVQDLGSGHGSRLGQRTLAAEKWTHWPVGTPLYLANQRIELKVLVDSEKPAELPSRGEPKEVLKQWLQDPAVTEIMVLGTQPIWVERGGHIEQTDTAFESEEALRKAIDAYLVPLNREVNQATPLVDGRLPDGSRFNVVLPPIALNGTTLTIRKFSNQTQGLDAWVAGGGLTEEAAQLLHRAVIDQRDVLVVGGTGTGKTTLLNALGRKIPKDQRLVSIEDAAELDLDHAHWVRLETRKSEEAGRVIDARGLVINALRMRPDRVLLGEVRGAEALELIQALNTGHRGCMSTIHANSAKAAARRLEILLLTSGIDWPLRAVKEQIAEALDLVVYLERGLDGQRFVSEIVELEGFDEDYRWNSLYRRVPHA